MEINPDIPSSQRVVDVGLHNLEMMGVEYDEPNRVVVGYTPYGAAACDHIADTIFIGSETMLNRDSSVIDFEHETVHYTQHGYLWPDVEEGFHDARQRVEQRALGNSVSSLGDSDYVESLVGEGHLTYDNFEVMLALASGKEGILEDIVQMKDGRERYLNWLREEHESREEQLMDDDSGLTRQEYSELAQSHSAWKAQEARTEFDFVEEVLEYVEHRWDEILALEATDFAEPVIDRYESDIEKPDDMMEAQAQFWSLFRAGAFEDIAEDGSDFYSDPLEERLSDIDEYYTDHRWYDHGDNVRNELEDRIERFRERVSDGAEPGVTAVDIVNQDYRALAD
ncbi:MAG: hypothetical protein ABEJ99_00675 [Candidatus Nanohaloarchaea archaeon]